MALSFGSSGRAGIGMLFRDRRAVQPRKFAGRGLSPHFVVTGLGAWSAQLMHAAVTTQQRAIKITDRHAELMKTAQKGETRFRDRTGNTRASVTIDSNPLGSAGYEVSIGPDFPTKGYPVARFLVFGTVRMSPKWDLFGLSQPVINSWQKQMEDLAQL